MPAPSRINQPSRIVLRLAAMVAVISLLVGIAFTAFTNQASARA